MISDLTRALIDATNKIASIRSEDDYVVVLTHKAYKELQDDKDEIIFVCKSDENEFPERFCGIDIELDDRMPPDRAGMIMLRSEWKRVKEHLDNLQENPLYYIDKQ